MKLSKKDYKPLIKEVKAGKSKAEAYKNCVEQGKDAKLASRFLSQYPDPDLRQKYQKQTFALLYVYLFFVLINLIFAIPLFMELGSINAAIFVLAIALLIPAFVTWSILMGEAWGYIIFAAFMLKGINAAFEAYLSDPVASWIGAGINLAMLVWVLSLKKKIFPYQNLLNTKKDENGISLFTAQAVEHSAPQ